MLVIVNADDLGMSTDVNAEIVRLMTTGCVTSATLLANGPAFDDALERSRPLRGCSIGVHLDAMEFAPLTDPARLAPIVGEDGRFRGNLFQVAIDRPLRDAILDEWSAQVGRILAAGVEVSHLDSHHHTHTVPALFPVLKRLQHRFGIRKVRITRNIYSPGTRPASRTLLAKKAIWNAALRTIVRTRTTAGFGEFLTVLEAARARRLRHRSVELMVHPGSPRSDAETEALEGDWMRSFPTRLRLVSYREL